MVDEYPRDWVVLSCGWTGPWRLVESHRATSRHLNDDPRACAGIVYEEE